MEPDEPALPLFAATPPTPLPDEPDEALVRGAAVDVVGVLVVVVAGGIAVWLARSDARFWRSISSVCSAVATLAASSTEFILAITCPGVTICPTATDTSATVPATGNAAVAFFR